MALPSSFLPCQCCGGVLIACLMPSPIPQNPFSAVSYKCRPEVFCIRHLYTAHSISAE